ncbi:MAG: hypothetical protein JNL57_10740 [Bacteroidetes bacterium]|nr:hypothetical protein [Bacteroidota bacterium]
MDSNPSLSRIHLLVDELNLLAGKPDVPDFKNRAEACTREVHDLGYRILSVYTLDTPELMTLPEIPPELLTQLQALIRRLDEPEMDQQEIFDIRSDIRQTERELVKAYMLSDKHTWFQLVSHDNRLIVYAETAGQPMNQYAEKYLCRKLIDIRTEYESWLWTVKQKYPETPDEKTLLQLLQQNRNELFKIHIPLIFEALKHTEHRKDYLFSNQLVQALNTFLMQAMRLNDPNLFRTYLFWHIWDKVRCALTAPKADGIPGRTETFF